MAGLFDSNIALTGKVLDLQLQRQNVVMSNLANVDVPTYKAGKLEFEGELQAALGRDAKGKLARTSSGHIPSVFDAKGFGGTMVKEFKPRVTYGADGVDLDKEMAAMAKNSMQYNALTTVMKQQFDGIQRTIMEGSK